ncbi:Hypothetical protein LUCI_1728 [Lucifera butyrica]|uniref:Ferredoxin n=1 Tax=Lucifera butyrica TaxID=1351585 RepID=A0A498R5V7_9FIRM|nr:Hypothetical protein LUCI_1728 [Lucifera butyrica]
MHTNWYECLVETIQFCEVNCENMATYFTRTPDITTREKQLQFLRDCADLCGWTSKYIARCSTFAKDIAGLCACICEACGKECLQHCDEESQHCARICLHCAKECRNFAYEKFEAFGDPADPPKVIHSYE